MTRLARVQKRLAKRRRNVERAIGRRDTLRDQRAALADEVKKGEEQRELYRKGVVFLEAVTENARRDVCAGFEDIVTQALRAILGDDYRLSVEYSLKRNAGHADFRVATGDDAGGDPLTSRGGGVVDILAFSLRVVVAELLGTPGPLILDEPFRHLSAEYVEKAGEVVAELAERFGRQVIIVTHKPACARLAHLIHV